MRSQLTRHDLLVLGVLCASTPTSALCADALDSTLRSVKASTFCSSEFCQGNESTTFSKNEPGPWFEGVGAFVPVAGSYAFQNTLVSLGLIGGVAEAAGNGGGSNGSWTGDSKLEATFTLDAPTPFSLGGTLSTEGIGSGMGSVSALALVELVGPGGTVFLHEASAGSFGGEVKDIDEAGELPAGTYTISMRAFAAGFSSEISYGNADAWYVASLSLCSDGAMCPADLNGDTAVDGADLGLLLAAWGETGGAGDLNCDGAIDNADLGLLLSAWGECS